MDELYYYCIIKTKLIKVTDMDNEYLKPDLPFRIYSYHAVSNGSDVTYSPSLSLDGEEIMACIAVKIEDKDKAKMHPGYIGDKFDTIKSDKDYTKHFPHTIADMKKKYVMNGLEAGELIEYTGIDKDEPARFCMWVEDDK